MLAKQEILLRWGVWVESRRGRELRGLEVCSLGGYGDGVSPSDSGCFLVASASLNQAGFQEKGFWEDKWTGVSF